MAYRIQYSPEDMKRYPLENKGQSVHFSRYAFILAVLAAAIWIRLNGVPDFLIPGDPEITRKAASMMMDELQTGGPFNDAVTVFCKEILHGAGF